MSLNHYKIVISLLIVLISICTPLTPSFANRTPRTSTETTVVMPKQQKRVKKKAKRLKKKARPHFRFRFTPLFFILAGIFFALLGLAGLFFGHFLVIPSYWIAGIVLLSISAIVVFFHPTLRQFRGRGYAFYHLLGLLLLVSGIFLLLWLLLQNPLLGYIAIIVVSTALSLGELFIELGIF